MTEPELQALCACWQSRLRLQDWNVTVKIVRARDMPSAVSNSAACCEWQLCKRRAVIRLLDPLDAEPEGPWPYSDEDQERSLVHELLHLHSAPYDDFKIDSRKDVALEQSIHAISLALVELERRDRPEIPLAVAVWRCVHCGADNHDRLDVVACGTCRKSRDGDNGAREVTVAVGAQR